MSSNHHIGNSAELEIAQTLRALSACAEALTAIADAEPNKGFGVEAPFNQRILSGLALAMWKLADYAYEELLGPAGDRRTLEFSVDADMAGKLDHVAAQWNCDRDEAASRLLSEQLREWARKFAA